MTESEDVDACLCLASTSKLQSTAAKLVADAAEGSWKCTDRQSTECKVPQGKEHITTFPSIAPHMLYADA